MRPGCMGFICTLVWRRDGFSPLPGDDSGLSGWKAPPGLRLPWGDPLNATVGPPGCRSVRWQLQEQWAPPSGPLDSCKLRASCWSVPQSLPRPSPEKQRARLMCHLFPSSFANRLRARSAGAHGACQAGDTGREGPAAEEEVRASGQALPEWGPAPYPLSFPCLGAELGQPEPSKALPELSWPGPCGHSGGWEMVLRMAWGSKRSGGCGRVTPVAGSRDGEG